MEPAQRITCPSCGGTAHLISFLPEDGEVEPGDILAYRCADCEERFDLVMSEEPEED